MAIYGIMANRERRPVPSGDSMSPLQNVLERKTLYIGYDIGLSLYTVSRLGKACEGCIGILCVLICPTPLLSLGFGNLTPALQVLSQGATGWPT